LGARPPSAGAGHDQWDLVLSSPARSKKREVGQHPALVVATCIVDLNGTVDAIGPGGAVLTVRGDRQRDLPSLPLSGDEVPPRPNSLFAGYRDPLNPEASALGAKINSSEESIPIAS